MGIKFSVPVVVGISGVIVIAAIFSLIEMESTPQQLVLYQIPSVLEADALNGNILVMNIKGFSGIPDQEIELIKLEHHVGALIGNIKGSEKNQGNVKVCTSYADDDQSSCWIRVSSPFTAKNWKALAIPRVGNEVIVTYVDGDPDRPLVVGSVYNNVKIQSTQLELSNTEKPVIKSVISYSFNEIIIEDLKGEEEIFIHADTKKHTIELSTEPTR